jgi:hypothetical protein
MGVHNTVLRLSRQMKRGIDAGLKSHRLVHVNDDPSWCRDNSSVPHVVVSRCGLTAVSSYVISIGTSCRDGEEDEILSSGQASPICKSLLFLVTESWLMMIVSSISG